MESDSMWPMILSALLGGFVFVFGFLRRFNEWYYVARFEKNNKNRPLPPGDMGWPIIGNLFKFLRAFKSPNPDSFISDLVSRYGQTGIYRTYLFGSPSIIVCTPETCRKVMSDDENFKVAVPKASIPLMGRRTFHNISNAEHKRLRRITTSPITGHEALALYIPCIERIVVDHLEHWSRSSRPVELLAEFRKAAFKVITTVFMGPGSDAGIEEVRELCGDLMAGIKSQVINFPGFTFHKALQSRKKTVKIIQNVLDEKRERLRFAGDGDENKKDMVDLLMGLKDEEGKQLEDEDIIDLLVVFLLAGHESSAHAALWAIIYLTQNPHFLTKAKEEQEEIMKRRPPTQEGLSLQEIKQMPYLSKVIDETLRRTSLNFTNYREAKVDVQLNGYTIPKGWKVWVWNRAVHMDSDIYQNPKKFDPERWENHRPRPGTFVPFGIGSRLCPGSDLAKLEISIFLHHFLLYYKVEILNPTAPPRYLPLPSPSDNCLAKVIKINK